ncbi:hypothetical protein A2415_00115 [candidate division WWE3 bacterium RIFOXYC1_FULL_39_7]|uniref:Uncharacterized protein n=1 Tax=candidate division WWE3 bacterium RIFOXYC1_FULL_39_7 TaxID=1802643 RepID=A0A1F4WLZ2_UNCKA|nr:MAG: hypothetical protein A2415_00115 [candidate division WWE3 bacterium RIFOXYC1_FULL_39_7]
MKSKSLAMIGWALIILQILALVAGFVWMILAAETEAAKVATDFAIEMTLTSFLVLPVGAIMVWNARASQTRQMKSIAKRSRRAV